MEIPPLDLGIPAGTPLFGIPPLTLPFSPFFRVQLVPLVPPVFPVLPVLRWVWGGSGRGFQECPGQ